MKVKQNIFLLLLVFMALILALGCANKTKELLAVKYQEMSDDDLLRYFYHLNDEIVRLDSQPGPRVGIGLGSYGRSTGGSIGISTGTGRNTTEDLKKRRIEVLLILKKRGLEP